MGKGMQVRGAIGALVRREDFNFLETVEDLHTGTARFEAIGAVEHPGVKPYHMEVKMPDSMRRPARGGILNR